VLLNPDFTIDTPRPARLAEHRPAWCSSPIQQSTGQSVLEAGDRRIVRRRRAVVIDEAYNAFARKTFMTRLAEFRISWSCVRCRSSGSRAFARLCRRTAEWIANSTGAAPPYNVSMLTHVVAERILAHHEVLDAQARSINVGRERLDGSCEAALRNGLPSDANFILVRVPDAARVFEGMRRRGVLVKNLHTGVPLLDHCVVLPLGRPRRTGECLAALRKALAEG